MTIDEPTSPEPKPSRLAKLVFWNTIAAAYLFSRAYALSGIPIFIDEAIHVDWANPSVHTFHPLDPSFDGKWLSIKLFTLATRLLLTLDSLIAARLTVAMFGLTTAFACYLIGRDLFSRIAGAASAVLYVVLPFTVIYNSLALADGLQLAFATWAVFAAVRVVRSDRWVWAAIALPLFISAAILSKFNALALLALPIIAVLLLTRPAEWLRGLLRIAPTLVTTLILVAWLHQRGLFAVFETKASSNWGEVRNSIWQNFDLTGDWFWGLLTPSIAILAIISFGWLLLRLRSPATWLVTVLLCIGVLPYVAIARHWYPRYLLLAVIPIVLAIGGAISAAVAFLHEYRRSRPQLGTVILALVIIGILSWPVARSTSIIFDLANANLPWWEKYQLVSGWPSGYGLNELVKFLREQNQATPSGIIVARTIFNDHPLHTLNIYLQPSEKLSLFTLADDNRAHAAFLASLSLRRRTLLVLSMENRTPERIREPSTPLLECGTPIWLYTRPGGTSGFVVYELACHDDQIKKLSTTNDNSKP